MLNFTKKIVIFSLRIIRLGLMLLFLLTLFGYLVPYISNTGSYSYLQSIINFESAINHTVKHYIPTTIFHYDLSRLLTLIILFIFIDIVRGLIDRLVFSVQRQQMAAEFKRIQATYHAPTPEHQDKLAQLAQLESKLEQAGSSKNRHELLKEFVNIKKELEKIGRDLAFLAIDVVDSTGMKHGEDAAVIEHDFHQYHDFVEAKFKEHGYIKAAWTPDGVMACFNTIEDAVQAAQAIIEGLIHFNRKVKVMKKDFQVRCGVNGGFVYYDDSIPLEHFSDRTIDIAGHMQKHAPPNSILIAKHIIEPVKSRKNFLQTEKLVDGLEVCEWKTLE